MTQILIKILTICKVAVIINLLNNVQSLNFAKNSLQNIKRLQDTVVDVPWISDFDNNKYQFRSGHYSWISAREFCLSQNSDLVTIKTEQKLNWILDHYKPLFQTTIKRLIHIGLLLDPTDSQTKEWHWVDGTFLNNTFFNWTLKELNNNKSKIEQCAAFDVNKKRIVAIACDFNPESNINYRFICEKDYKNILQQEETLFSSFLEQFKNIIHSLKLDPFSSLIEKQENKTFLFDSINEKKNQKIKIADFNTNYSNTKLSKTLPKNTFQFQNINNSKIKTTKTTMLTNNEKKLINLFERMPMFFNNNLTHFEPNPPVFIAHFSKMYVPIKSKKLPLKNKKEEFQDYFVPVEGKYNDNYTLEQLAQEIEEALLFSNNENFTYVPEKKDNQNFSMLDDDIHNIKQFITNVEKMMKISKKNNHSVENVLSHTTKNNMFKINKDELNGKFKKQEIINNKFNNTNYNLTDNLKKNYSLKIADSNDTIDAAFNIENDFVVAEIENVTRSLETNHSTESINGCKDEKNLTKIEQFDNNNNILETQDFFDFLRSFNELFKSQILFKVEEMLKKKNLNNPAFIEKLAMNTFLKPLPFDSEANSNNFNPVFNQNKSLKFEEQLKKSKELNDEYLHYLKKLQDKERKKMIAMNQFNIIEKTNKTILNFKKPKSLFKNKKIQNEKVKYKKTLDLLKNTTLTNQISTNSYLNTNNINKKTSKAFLTKITTETLTTNNNILKLNNSKKLINHIINNANKSHFYYIYKNALNFSSIENDTNNTNYNVSLQPKTIFKNSSAENPTKELIEIVLAIQEKFAKNNEKNLTNQYVLPLNNHNLESLKNESNSTTFPLPNKNVFNSTIFQKEIENSVANTVEEKKKIDKVYEKFQEKMGSTIKFVKKIINSDAKKLIVKQSNSQQSLI